VPDFADAVAVGTPLTEIAVWRQPPTGRVATTSSPTGPAALALSTEPGGAR
jgi:hypothetical protein